MKTVLITGAAGDVGTHLRRELAGRYKLRVSDIKPIKDLAQGREVRARRRFEAARHAARDARASTRIVHLGAWPVEGDWPLILSSNIIGAYNGFEAARRNGVKRVMFASSNHAVGFYRRDETIDHLRGAEARQPLRRVQGVRRGARRALRATSTASGCSRSGSATSTRSRSTSAASRSGSARATSPSLSRSASTTRTSSSRSCTASPTTTAPGTTTRTRTVSATGRIDKSEAYAASLLAKHQDNPNPLVEVYQGGTFVAAEDGGDPSRAHLVSRRAKRTAKKRAAPKKTGARKRK